MDGAAMRGRGRPRGSRDMHGAAQRVDARVLPLYLVEFAKRLRDERLERDISPDELAEAAGIGGGSNVLRIERCASGHGRLVRGPSLTLMVRLALALGLMPSELLP